MIGGSVYLIAHITVLSPELFYVHDVENVCLMILVMMVLPIALDVAKSLIYMNRNQYSKAKKPQMIQVFIKDQMLYLLNNAKVEKRYPISTSKYGNGNKNGSKKTPLGDHLICSKIGKNAPVGSIFVKRRNTGKLARIHRRSHPISSDLITTRILRLRGLQDGINCGDGIDSFKRCIYIHGTPEEHLIGMQASHGCIRMKNRHIIELFDLVKRGTLVKIR